MIRLVAGLGAAAWSLVARSALAQEAKGAYTDQQAIVGEAYFRGYCVECHGPTDMANENFKAKWHGRSVFDLFERLRTSMPDGAPGSLPRQTYADIVAYFLKLNGAPVGTAPLSSDSLLLSRTRLELRAAAAPSPSPSVIPCAVSFRGSPSLSPCSRPCRSKRNRILARS